MSDTPLALAGIDVHGIQRFVFRGSRLREIIGGSHLVDLATARWPHEVADDLGLGTLRPGEAGTWRPIRTAGGRIRAAFGDRDTAHRWCAALSERILDEAPGLDFTTAIVDGHEDVATHQSLHRRLESRRLQAGADASFQGFPFTAPCRATGDAASGYGRRKNERLSEEMLVRQQSAHDANDDLLETIRRRIADHTVLSDAIGGLGIETPLRWPLDLSEMLPEGTGGSYMGVIAFDGNEIGRRIQDLVSASGNDAGAALAEFSRGLAACTREAIAEAVEETLFELHRRGTPANGRGRLPLRVLLEGGDDVILVVRADLALPMARHLLSAFERATTATAAVGSLKAAAGVAVTKAKAPILSAVELAEQLLAEAKDAGRDRSRISSYLAHASLPSSLAADRDTRWRAADGSRLTGWPRTVDDTVTLETRARFVAHELPRSQVRTAADDCRRSKAEGDAAFDRLRDVTSRDLAGLGDARDRTARLESFWPTGWFHDAAAGAWTDLLDCIDLTRFVATTREIDS